MEINKQLFEDVLSGKLKGIFVLRNGQKINSNNLCKSDWGKFCYRFTNTPYVFTCNGYINSGDIPYEQDVIDFIQDTNMKEKELTIDIKEVDFDLYIAKKIFFGEIRGKITNNGNYPILILDINENEDYPLVTAVNGKNGWNIIKYNKKGVPQGWDGYKQTLHLKIQLQNMKENELTIEIPNGKIVDWDESKKQNKIILKDQLTYEDICKKIFINGYYFMDEIGGIEDGNINKDVLICGNNAISKHQLECIRAKNLLANVAIYLNNGWKPSYNSEGNNYDAWVLYLTPKKDYIGILNISNCSQNSNVFFKSEELAKQAIEIAGEEIIKLALEPLGI